MFYYLSFIKIIDPPFCSIRNIYFKYKTCHNCISSIIGISENKHNKKIYDIVLLPKPINLPLRDASTKVLGMAAGRAHLLILTTDGLFTLGNNAYGQCGRPIVLNEDYKKSMIIHHIPNIKGKKITAVTAGQDHRYDNSNSLLIT
jgi:hypothetical protein